MGLNTALTVLVTVCLALTGYLYSLFLARRKDRLDRINRQLSDLYGPLRIIENSIRRNRDRWPHGRNQEMC
jgi:hypothetical protein